MVCEETYFYSIAVNYRFRVSSSNKANTKIVSLRTNFNGSVKVKWYDTNDVAPYYLRTFHKIISVHLHLYISQHNNMTIQ